MPESFPADGPISIKSLSDFIGSASASAVQLGADIDGEAAGDFSGSSVSINADGTIIAVGANSNDDGGTSAGHVRVFKYSSGSWSQLGSDIDGEAALDLSGSSVSINADGTILAVGAYKNDGNGSDSGHVRIFEYSSGSWSQLGSDIDGEASGDESGYNISLNSDGTILAVGATKNDGSGSNAGQVRVFVYFIGSWSQLGSDIDGEAALDLFGTSVSLNSAGTILAVGAHQNDGSGAAAGHVRIFEYSLGSWSQLGSDIDGEAPGDQSGNVSLNAAGTIVAVGAFYNGWSGSYPSLVAGHGQVRIFEYSLGSWSQLGSDIDGEAIGDLSGWSVSLDSTGTIVVVGAHQNDGSGSGAGHARIFKYSSGSWSQLGNDIDGEAAGDFSGSSVSINADGTIIAVGAHSNDDGGTYAGHVRVYAQSASSALGAPYSLKALTELAQSKGIEFPNGDFASPYSMREFYAQIDN